MKCSWQPQFLNFRASISDKEIDEFKDAKQYYSDCYLMTSLEALSKIPNGRKILKNQLQHDDTNPKQINCYLYNPSGKRLKYPIPVNEVVEGYNQLYNNQKNDIIRSLDISVGEYEKKYKAKPLICRVKDTFNDFAFEYNLPSHFLNIFTGIKPTVNIAESDFNVDLTGHKDEVMKLFERMDKDKNYSMLISTGIKAHNGHAWHVYILEDVDLKNNIVKVKEKRGNVSETMSVDEALKTFKFIVGYFDEDLKNTKKESLQ